MKIFLFSFMFSSILFSNELAVSGDVYMPFVPFDTSKGLSSQDGPKSDYNIDVLYSFNKFLIGLGYYQFNSIRTQKMTSIRPSAAFISENNFSYLSLGYKEENGSKGVLLLLDVGSEKFILRDQNSAVLNDYVDSYLRIDVGGKYFYKFDLTKNISIFPEVGFFLNCKDTRDFSYQNISYGKTEFINHSINFELVFGLGFGFH